ncbi:MAG TPA: CBS domain-containing protein [Dehalococcoidales bacterium]|nr:CBS domain-containing protein [Dehalococcoidales bacterium]
MKLSDVMTTNVVSIPSDTSLSEARRIMDAHNYRRLPVIDKNKLVGVVTRDALDRMGPSSSTTFSIHEISYLLSTMKVKQVMRHDVLTVSPDMDVDDAVTLAQEKGIGMLIVVENGRVVGVVTTNDFFYRILNPILGIKMPGTRIYVQNCYKPSDVEKVIGAIKDAGINIISMYLINTAETEGARDLMIHLDAVSCSKCVDDIKRLGFMVVVKNR